MVVQKKLRMNIFLFILLLSSVSSVVRAAVTYDGRSFMINGQRKILISGSIHYPRSTPDMWPDLIQNAKDGGLDVIQTYVFWNLHEPTPGTYNFEGRADLVQFLKLVQAAGLYAHLRIGPYVCAEWNFGGFPVWLKYVPGIEFRTDNGPFEAAMQGFVTHIVNLMTSESLFEPQGGPIIMSQIENEYGPIEWAIGAPGVAYTAWFSQMAVAQNTSVPWVVCKQDDAPNPIIDACNGFYCQDFVPNEPYKPKMFTENWTGWYTQYGGANPHRPAEDLAFAVATFIQNNGSFCNYYMYHGGTNFGRTSGLFVTTSYDYDAPIDEYGQLNEPKYSHLRDLHLAIKQAETALVSSYPTVIWLGSNQEANVFQSNTGGCAAFLSNFDQINPATVTFQNVQYNLPPWSISILPDCKTVVYNTATVNNAATWPTFTPVGGALSWQTYSDVVPSADDTDALPMIGLWEQINVTQDSWDYLWYLTSVNISANEGFLTTGQYPLFSVTSAGDVLHVFINGQLSGSVYGSLDNPQVTFNGNVTLNAGINYISLLSDTVGLPNVGLHFEQQNTGVLGPITLSGLSGGTMDLTKQQWSYKVGLGGESLSLNTPSGSASVQWEQGSSLATNQPLTWYKTTFVTPAGNDPLALDMGSMGKGEIWVNGQSIGRHWAAYIAQGNCGACNYAGTFTQTKCQMYCGEPSQRWYHIPRSWLNSSGQNLLVVLEELGGDPTWITLLNRTRS